MKKFITVIVFALFAIVVKAQSFEIHQSYNDSKSAWGQSRFIAEYFWSNESGKVNVFSWNSFSQNGISGLLYGEYMLGNTGLFAHGEVRAQMGNFDYKTITPEIGLAYLLPIDVDGLGIYLTPKYVYKDVYCAKHDFEFSVNSSFENDYVYYEGYLDTNWVKGFNCFTEQKAYYKITKNVQFGACVVFNAYNGYHSVDGSNSHCQPYLSLRFGLY